MRSIGKSIRIWIFCVSGLCLAIGAEAQIGHPSFLAEAHRDDSFPRFTLEQLMANGYPDHQHAYFSPRWVPLEDKQGRAYGMGSLCKGLTLLSPEGLISNPGELIYGPITFRFNTGYQPCQVAPFLELCDMALHIYKELLSLEPTGRLLIINPDKVVDYARMTGYGTWRTFKLEQNECIVEPVNVLASRTLIAHAAIDLIGQWLVREKSNRLPEWFIQGVGGYIAEMGTHYINYVAMFRSEGPILIAPDEIDKILKGPALKDPGRDQKMFRIARYSAFIMVWRLVENNGGLESLAGFLDAVAGGSDPDQVALNYYKRDLADLAAALDPTRYAEPIGDAITPLNPNRIPVRGPVKQGSSR